MQSIISITIIDMISKMKYNWFTNKSTDIFKEHVIMSVFIKNQLESLEKGDLNLVKYYHSLYPSITQTLINNNLGYCTIPILQWAIQEGLFDLILFKQSQYNNLPRHIIPFIKHTTRLSELVNEDELLTTPRFSHHPYNACHLLIHGKPEHIQLLESTYDNLYVSYEHAIIYALNHGNVPVALELFSIFLGKYNCNDYQQTEYQFEAHSIANDCELFDYYTEKVNEVSYMKQQLINWLKSCCKSFTETQFIESAIINGNTRAFARILRSLSSTIYTNPLILAVISGSFEMLRVVMLTTNYSYNPIQFDIQSNTSIKDYYDNDHITKLLTIDEQMSFDPLLLAIHLGNLPFAQIIHSLGFTLAPHAYQIVSIMKESRTDILFWLLTSSCPYDPTIPYLTNAMLAKNIDHMNWFSSYACCPIEMIHELVCDDVRILHWLTTKTHYKQPIEFTPHLDYIDDVFHKRALWCEKRTAQLVESIKYIETLFHKIKIYDKLIKFIDLLVNAESFVEEIKSNFEPIDYDKFIDSLCEYDLIDNDLLIYSKN